REFHRDFVCSFAPFLNDMPAPAARRGRSGAGLLRGWVTPCYTSYPAEAGTVVPRDRTLSPCTDASPSGRIDGFIESPPSSGALPRAPFFCLYFGRIRFLPANQRLWHRACDEIGRNP